MHALLGIPGRDDLLAHPVVGTSWEGFVIENLLAAVQTEPPPPSSGPRGVEVDPILVLPDRERWAIEIMRTPQPKRSRGFDSACEDLKPARRCFAYAGDTEFPLGGDTRVIVVAKLMEALLAAGGETLPPRQGQRLSRHLLRPLNEGDPARVHAREGGQGVSGT